MLIQIFFKFKQKKIPFPNNDINYYHLYKNKNEKNFEEKIIQNKAIKKFIYFYKYN